MLEACFWVGGACVVGSVVLLLVFTLVSANHMVALKIDVQKDPQKPPQKRFVFARTGRGFYWHLVYGTLLALVHLTYFAAANFFLYSALENSAGYLALSAATLLLSALPMVMLGRVTGDSLGCRLPGGPPEDEVETALRYVYADGAPVFFPFIPALDVLVFAACYAAPVVLVAALDG